MKDCEDITLGSGPDSGASYVYLGDIGDNGAGRKYITIYRIKEPHLSDSIHTVPSIHVEADPLYLQYPDGPRDAETLMADPIDKLLYISVAGKARGSPPAKGEAICFTIDGKGYYTVSEGVHPELFYYKLPRLIISSGKTPG